MEFSYLQALTPFLLCIWAGNEAEAFSAMRSAAITARLVRRRSLSSTPPKVTSAHRCGSRKSCVFISLFYQSVIVKCGYKSAINGRGFLLSFQLFTLVRKGTSLETNKTFKPTNSDAQEVDVSEQDARLSFVDPLACDLRPSPDAASRGSQAREAGGLPALGRLPV